MDDGMTMVVDVGWFWMMLDDHEIKRGNGAVVGKLQDVVLHAKKAVVMSGEKIVKHSFGEVLVSRFKSPYKNIGVSWSTKHKTSFLKTR